MKVLVTGHEGYIGSILAPMLQDRHYDVVGLDTSWFASDLLGSETHSIPGIRKDIRNVTAGDLTGIHAVIHLAALSNDPLGNLSDQVTYDINCEATVHLAEVAKAAGVSRFLFSSTCSIYGAANTDDLLDETAPLNPVTPYGRSKILAETRLMELADRCFSPVFVRSATSYGFSPRLRADLVVNNLAGWAFLTGRVLVFSDGTPWRPVVHVEDISRAFVALLEAPRDYVHNQAFNVGRNEENYQVRQLANIVCNAVSGTTVEFAGHGQSDSRCYRVNFSKIAQWIPAFKPMWRVSQGVDELTKAYRQYDLSLADFDGPRFQRIKRVRQLLQEGLLDGSLRWVGDSHGEVPVHGVAAGFS